MREGGAPTCLMVRSEAGGRASNHAPMLATHLFRKASADVRAADVRGGV